LKNVRAKTGYIATLELSGNSEFRLGFDDIDFFARGKFSMTVNSHGLEMDLSGVLHKKVYISSLNLDVTINKDGSVRTFMFVSVAKYTATILIIKFIT